MYVYLFSRQEWLGPESLAEGNKSLLKQGEYGAELHPCDVSPDYFDHRNRRPSILNDRHDNLLQNSDALGDVVFDDTRNKELSDSLPRHRPDRSVAECDGLEDLPHARRIGNAIRHARGLYGRADDKP